MTSQLTRLAQRLRQGLRTLFPCFPVADAQDEKAIPQQDGRTEHDILASQIDGQTYHIPDYWKVFKDWPIAENKHAARLEAFVNELLERVVTNPRKLKALKQADFGRLLTLWYPTSEWSELEMATAYTVWIFLWDDEVDEGETDVANDEEVARVFYKRSLTICHRLLGLETSGDGKELDYEEEEQDLGRTMELFAGVGRAMRVKMDGIQRERFFRELENYVVQVGAEQGFRIRGEIPTVARYEQIRMGSVGCGPQLSFTDVMLYMRLPETIMNCEGMKGLWRATIVLCLILNDIYSVQKEIAQNSLFGLIPVMFNKKQNMTTVTKDVDDYLKQTVKEFEEAAVSLTKEVAGDEKLTKEVEEYIKWCRHSTTAVLQWSLESRRYGMAKCINEDRTLTVVL
ncbi:terpenoid synthase [Hypoxylon sp. NC1633]|nr:terpenoid synthase [Hypoxylon sp. NC1633]